MRHSFPFQVSPCSVMPEGTDCFHQWACTHTKEDRIKQDLLSVCLFLLTRAAEVLTEKSEILEMVFASLMSMQH